MKQDAILSVESLFASLYECTVRFPRAVNGDKTVTCAAFVKRSVVSMCPRLGYELAKGGELSSGSSSKRQQTASRQPG